VKSYGYDSVSRTTSLGEDLAGTANDLTLAFTYNNASQIASTTRSNDAYAWTGHYNLNRSYAANGLNQYTASGSVTPTYDARGNLTSAGATTYGYTSDNLLTHKSGADIANYDGLLRLSRLGSAGQPATKFNYDGTALIGEYDGTVSTISLQRRYVHGPGSDEPLVWYEGSGTTDRRFLHSDERGSVVAVTNSSGTTIATNVYDEYGIPSSGNLGRFQYTGQTWLPELGMYYFKARVYSPTLGRFLQPDPIGYGDGMNMYAYVGGDPVNFTDPTGLECVSWREGGGAYDDGEGGAVVVAGRLKNACWSNGGGGGGTRYFDGGGGGGGGGGGEEQPICHGPPTPKGADRAKLAALTRRNAKIARDAARQVGPITAPLWFHSSVRSGGPWDYKRSTSRPRGGPMFEDFGNYHYGYVGTAMGFPAGMLLREAGRAQIGDGTSRPEWGTPGHPIWGGGKPPYGDDPVDQGHIRNGISDAENDC
jgi:RHS repeat-associated protein